MDSHNTRKFPLRALFALVALAPALASAEPRFEITPFVGGRIGGGFDVVDQATGQKTSADLGSAASYGVDLGLYANDNGIYELLYSTQKAKLDTSQPQLDNLDVRVDYLHFGGTAFFPDERFYVPYVSFTVGATMLEPQKSGYSSETKFSLSLGGGFRFPISEHAAVVLGLRGYLTLIDSNTDLFCISGPSQAGCLVKSSGTSFFQTEGQLGFSFAF